MKIAIEGCVHGELNKIYETIQYIERKESVKIDLLICCGDFQSVRNEDDMNSMAVPPKYREMKDFLQYYSGKKTAPVLTIFIGGNHEAANYLWELPYGGWVAKNIYYMGYAGVLNFGGLRIGGISGIYKQKDYYKSHFETPPFTEDTKRSFYHVRSLDVAKLKLLKKVPFDIFLSHDWPKRIYDHGDSQQLLRFKPFLRDEINSNTLGSVAGEELLNTLQPTYWFSGHMHAKFSALVKHSENKNTRFLALDKCLPRRNFLQIVDVGEMTDEPVLKYDKYWLCVLRSTNETFSTFSKQTFLAELTDIHKPTENQVSQLDIDYDGDFHVFPFTQSVVGKNDQTRLFCSKYKLRNPCELNSSILNNHTDTASYSVSQRKLVLSQPKQNLSLKPEFVNLKRPDDEDFNELTNPNTSNPDEIDVSDDDSSDKSDLEEGNNVINTTKTTPSIGFVSELPSFIETPLALKGNNVCVSELHSSDAADVSSISDDKDSCSQTPIPKKKFKLVRRNQGIYTPSHDEES